MLTFFRVWQTIPQSIKSSQAHRMLHSARAAATVLQVRLEAAGLRLHSEGPGQALNGCARRQQGRLSFLPARLEQVHQEVRERIVLSVALALEPAHTPAPVQARRLDTPGNQLETPIVRPHSQPHAATSDRRRGSWLPLATEPV